MAYETLEKISEDEKERDKYLRREMWLHDEAMWKGERRRLEEKSKREGREEGIKEGMEKGIEKGIAVVFCIFEIILYISQKIEKVIEI
ncbi:MAG TPA: hypothetical protein DCP90_08750 [Clostridiales bacterium]|nr:MAG: hypothetical protein A2Y22_03180 [Clostridiales bacterium GWD2_32_59]HAN10683.1 hypothetical protein [Clostridiales bacterium]